MPELTQAVLPASVRAQLAVIETELLRAAEARTELVTEAARQSIAAGGKRFRPLLVLLGAAFGETSATGSSAGSSAAAPLVDDDVVRGALVVELTHVASLFHDDVMDDARIRRGSPSANARWGNSVAILVGDFLFARASDIVAELGPEYVSLQARTFSRLVQGQIAETVGPGADEDPLEHYLQVVADKTGALIATSALFGAKLGGASVEVQTILAEFGEQIGVVFQLSDDIIDITSDDTGKTPGTDLREGVPTLPTLLVHGSDDPADARLRDLLGSDLHDDAQLAEALGLLRVNPALDRARADVLARAEAARQLLAPLPDGPAKAALVDLCDSVVSRTS